jgi:hypothetical protein
MTIIPEKSTVPDTDIEDPISAYEFAARAGVSPTSVYRKITAGIIVAKMYGKYKLIDWNKYKNVVFESNRTKNKDQNEPKTD